MRFKKSPADAVGISYSKVDKSPFSTNDRHNDDEPQKISFKKRGAGANTKSHMR